MIIFMYVCLIFNAWEGECKDPEFKSIMDKYEKGYGHVFGNVLMKWRSETIWNGNFQTPFYA